MIADSSIEEVHHRVSIYDVVSPLMDLKKIGHQYRGLSPFTNEKTPSFYINPDKNVFYCYSSGQGGGVIRFIQLYEKLTFAEAVQALADRFQIDLKYKNEAYSREKRSHHKELIDIHEQVCDLYHRYFKGNDISAQKIRDYWLKERKFAFQTAEEFKIGFAPPQEEDLRKKILKGNYSIDALKDSGLFFFRKGENDPRRFRMRFQGRLMIPIRNYQGQVIAFTGRKLDCTPQDDPAYDAKYINSPETRLFKKSAIVFGMDVARKYFDTNKDVERSFILVEGQLDALRCWECGLRNAVAPQGTAITEQQMYLLKRYADIIFCMLDGDSAGQKAALRLIPLALKTGHDIRFLPLEKGVDPDCLLTDGKKEAFIQLQQKVQTVIPFATRLLLPNNNPTAIEKNKARNQLFAFIEVCQQEDLRQNYLQEVGRCLKLTDFDDRAIHRDFRQYLYKKNHRKIAFQSTQEEKKTKPLAITPLTTAEYELLFCLFHYSSIREDAAKIIDNEWIDCSSPEGLLLSRVLADMKEELWSDHLLYNSLDENSKEQNLISSILSKELQLENPVKAVNECIKVILNKFLQKRMRQLENQDHNFSNVQQFAEMQRKIIELRRLKNTPPQLSEKLNP